MPIQIEELVIKAELQIDQQAQTNKLLAEINQTLARILERLEKLEDAVRSIASMR